LGGGYEYETSQRMKWGVSWVVHISRFSVGKKVIEKSITTNFAQKKKKIGVQKKNITKKVGLYEFLATFRYFFTWKNSK